MASTPLRLRRALGLLTLGAAWLSVVATSQADPSVESSLEEERVTLAPASSVVRRLRLQLDGVDGVAGESVVFRAQVQVTLREPSATFEGSGTAQLSARGGVGFDEGDLAASGGQSLDRSLTVQCPAEGVCTADFDLDLLRRDTLPSPVVVGWSAVLRASPPSPINSSLRVTVLR